MNTTQNGRKSFRAAAIANLTVWSVRLLVALTQPILLAGAPRAFAILNGTLALVVGLGLHLWWLGFPAGAAQHAAAVVMGKRDPDWFDVFRRHLRQPTCLAS